MAYFIYPPNGKYQQNISVQDEISVQYSTPWKSANLYLYCRETPNGDYQQNRAPGNPLPSSSLYSFPGLPYIGTTIQTLPSQCHYKLINPANSSENVIAPEWTLESVPGPANTYAPIQIPATTSSTTPVPTATITSSIATTTTAATHDSGQSSHSTGLSSVASVGIGIGVAIGVILLTALAVVAFYYRRKRKITKTSDPLDGVEELACGEKAELPAISKYSPVMRQYTYCSTLAQAPMSARPPLDSDVNRSSAELP